jgi:hypothetical protein
MLLKAHLRHADPTLDVTAKYSHRTTVMLKDGADRFAEFRQIREAPELLDLVTKLSRRTSRFATGRAGST